MPLKSTFGSLPGVVLPLIFVLAACANSPEMAGAAPTSSPAVTPYVTATLGAADATATTAQTQAPTPTATPQTYIIVAGDTLLGIAERFGITLDELLAANPGVDARFLSLGQEIFVPASSGSAGEDASLATPEPLPLPLSDPACYASATGELRCFLLVTNTGSELVEALAGGIQLVSADGVALASADATAPLNALPAGAALPLVAYWQDPPAGWSRAQGQLTSGFAVGDPTRYLDAELVNDEIEITASGLSARAMGELQLPDGAQAGLIWVLAVAYNENDEVVGVRRWESEGSDSTFEFWVYSLGAPIERVELLMEARP